MQGAAAKERLRGLEFLHQLELLTLVLELHLLELHSEREIPFSHPMISLLRAIVLDGIGFTARR